MDLEIKGVAASPRRLTTVSSKETKLAQEWQQQIKASRGPRPAEVPCLDLGKLGDSEDEDEGIYPPCSTDHCHTGTSSIINRGPPLKSPYAQHYNVQQTTRKTDHQKTEFSLLDENIIPENLPPPANAYKLKYQQYEAEMKEGYKQYSQRATEKEEGKGHSLEFPRETIVKKNSQHENRVNDELTVFDEKALLQQSYTSKPYTVQHSIRKLEAEDVAAERKKQAVVEQVMIDQLSRAVISDLEQNGIVATYERDSVPGGLRTAPLRFRKRTLHETKIRTKSALTENMLSHKLRFEGRLISRNGRDACRELIGFFFVCDKSLTVYEYRQFGKNRTSVLPFIQKGVYSHQRGRRKGKQYSLNDFYVGADLSFLSLHHPGLPESIKQKPVFTVRVTNIDETARDILKTFASVNMEYSVNEQVEDKNILKNVQERLREKLRKRGVRIVTRLGKYFRDLEKKQNGILTKADFRQALKEFHLEVHEEEFESLWLILGDNTNEPVDYLEFTHVILGEMSEYRKAYVRKAFMKLDYNKTGSVPIVNIEKCYCARKHPEVLAGNATEEEIKSSFLETLQDVCSNPYEVSFCEFEDYYEGLSIGIIDDEDFANTLRNPWGI